MFAWFPRVFPFSVFIIYLLSSQSLATVGLNALDEWRVHMCPLVLFSLIPWIKLSVKNCSLLPLAQQFFLHEHFLYVCALIMFLDSLGHAQKRLTLAEVNICLLVRFFFLPFKKCVQICLAGAIWVWRFVSTKLSYSKEAWVFCHLQLLSIIKFSPVYELSIFRQGNFSWNFPRKQTFFSGKRQVEGTLSNKTS